MCEAPCSSDAVQPLVSRPVRFPFLAPFPPYWAATYEQHQDGAGPHDSHREDQCDRLEPMTEALGPNAPEFAGIHHNLAGLLHVQGRFDEAEPEALRALSLRTLSGPPDPAGMAADMSVLGAVLAEQGRFDDPEDRLRTALRIWEFLYRRDHYEVAVQLNNLASIQQERGENGTASVDYERGTRSGPKSSGSRRSAEQYRCCAV